MGSNIIDNLDRFLEILPTRVLNAIEHSEDIHALTEVVLDFGRPIEARFLNRTMRLQNDFVSMQDIGSVINKVGQFGNDNRAGIERTLHRISSIRNRAGETVGLTCRVGRAVQGSIKLIEEIIKKGASTLLLGRPGIGKTTMLREIARVLADDEKLRVIIVDTSNEIAGDGNIPHEAIGSARRMQVPSNILQHEVMIEAVENHMPEVIIIDEISTEKESLAARTIAERGVQLVATAHGNTLQNIILNPVLSDLIGSIRSVTLGDVEARRRRSQKTVAERERQPTFDVVVEIKERNYVSIHSDTGKSVDRMLQGQHVQVQNRFISDEGYVANVKNEFYAHDSRHKSVSSKNNSHKQVSATPPDTQPTEEQFNTDNTDNKPSNADNDNRIKVYPFGIPVHTLQFVADKHQVPLVVVDDPKLAKVFVTTKSHYNKRTASLKYANKTRRPVYVIHSPSTEHISKFVTYFNSGKLKSSNKQLPVHTQDATTLNKDKLPHLKFLESIRNRFIHRSNTDDNNSIESYTQINNSSKN